MNGRKAIWGIEQSYPPNGERSGEQDRHRQDETDSAVIFLMDDNWRVSGNTGRS